MDPIISSFSRAFSLILNMDRELMEIILMSMKVSGAALFAASALGLPIGVILALRRFPGRGIVITLVNTFTGLPPVVVGLFLYLILSRSGPLGFLGLLYTPWAMMIAQCILALPIISALSHSAIVGVNRTVTDAARALGATPIQVTMVLLREARYGIMAAIITAFGRVIAEVGAVLIVGGNIAGYTRVMTTAIALETDRGEFELALALGIVLITLSFGVNILLHLVQRKGMRTA